jgi:hypothetical protein
MRLKVSHLLALVVIAALSVGLMADVAAAKPARAHKTHKMSAKQKRHIRAQLRRQVKKNPAVVKRKSFLRKASLVNFELPVTIRLRGVPTPIGQNQEIPNVSNGNYLGNFSGIGGNPNVASVDLGPSLGQRQISLGGSLSGNIVFHDSFDGGALGNVSLELKPDTNGTGPDHSLKTTSIPLLWNQQVTQAGSRYDLNDLGALDPTFTSPSSSSGCADWKTGGNLPTGNDVAKSGPYAGYSALSTSWITFGRGFVSPSALSTVFNPAFTNAGYPGYPYFNSTGALAVPNTSVGPYNPNGFLPIFPGQESINNVVTADVPGLSDVVGPSQNPFPIGTPPGAPYSSPPSAQDTVLRTNALSLGIAPVGSVIQSGDGDHPSGSQDIVVGKSGGEANLFGNIPGKSYGIDITASFKTQISSIIRVVDQDSYHTKLIAGNRWPAGVFNCRQIWTGYVTNYIPGVRLVGNLRIAPGLTADGHLRIAKAVVGSASPTRFAVAACLSPDSNYAADNPNYSSDNYAAANGSDGPGTFIPNPGAGTYAAGIAPEDAGGAYVASATTEVPVREDLPARSAPNYQCDTHQTGLVHYSALNTTVPFLAPAVPGDGYNSSTDGSRVSVGADLNVQNVSVDVLIGDV